MRVLPQRNHDRRLRVDRTDEERRRLPCAERQYPRPSDPREFTKCGQSAPGGGGAAFRGDPWHPPGDPSRYEHEAGRNEHSRRAGRGPPATRYRPQPKSFRRAAVVWLTSDWPMRIRPSVPHGGGWNHRAVECGPEASCTKSCRLSFDGSSAFHPSALQPWQTKSDTPISHRRNLQRRRASNSPSLGQVGRLRKPPERPRKFFLHLEIRKVYIRTNRGGVHTRANPILNGRLACAHPLVVGLQGRSRVDSRDFPSTGCSSELKVRAKE